MKLERERLHSDWNYIIEVAAYAHTVARNSQEPVSSEATMHEHNVKRTGPKSIIQDQKERTSDLLHIVLSSTTAFSNYRELLVALVPSNLQPFHLPNSCTTIRPCLPSN